MAKWSRERIIREILCREASGLSLDLGGANPVHSSLYQAASRVFGSWRNAVMAAGIAPEKARVHDPWSPARILAGIKSLARRKRHLRPAELKRRYHPLVAAARKRFGSWPKAVVAAGVEPDKLKRVMPWAKERILKPLCNTERAKRITWLSNLTLNDKEVPASFVTTSSVILIANEWRTVNPSVRAFEDRAIILHFAPPKAEVHRRVAEWFDDADVYEFIERILPLITELSMRHYCKGSQLRRAGMPDWRSSLLQMVLPDPRMACVVALQHDSTLKSEQERIEHFVTATGCSRATYFRMKARLGDATSLENGR